MPPVTIEILLDIVFHANATDTPIHVTVIPESVTNANILQREIIVINVSLVITVMLLKELHTIA